MLLIERIMMELDLEGRGGGPIPIREQVRNALIEVHNETLEEAAEVAESAYDLGSWDEEEMAGRVERAQSSAGHSIAEDIRARKIES